MVQKVKSAFCTELVGKARTIGIDAVLSDARTYAVCCMVLSVMTKFSRGTRFRSGTAVSPAREGERVFGLAQLVAVQAVVVTAVSNSLTNLAAHPSPERGQQDLFSETTEP